MSLLKPDTFALVSAASTRPGTWTDHTTGTPPDANWNGGGDFTTADRFRASYTTGGYPAGTVKRWRFYLDLDVQTNQTGELVGVAVRARGIPGIPNEELLYVKRSGVGTVDGVSAWYTPPGSTGLAALDDSAQLDFIPSASGSDEDFAFELLDYGIEYEFLTDVGGGGDGSGGSGAIDQTVNAEIEAAGAGAELEFYVSGRGLVVPVSPTSTELKATTSASAAKVGDTFGTIRRASSFTAAVTAVYREASLWLRRVGNPLDTFSISLYADSSDLPGTLLAGIGQIVPSDLTTVFQEVTVSTVRALSWKERVLADRPRYFYRMNALVDITLGILSFKYVPNEIPQATTPWLIADDTLDPPVVESGELTVDTDNRLAFNGSRALTVFPGILTTRNAGLSVEFFLRWTSGIGVLFYNGSLAGGTGFAIGVGGTTFANAGVNLLLRLGATYFDTTYNVVNTASIHLVVQHTGSAWQVWVDGALMFSTTTALAAYTTGTTAVFADGEGGSFLTGSIDELALYEFPLSDDQIRSHALIALEADLSFLGLSASLTASTQYWIEIRRLGTADASNHVEVEFGTNGTHGSTNEIASSPNAPGWGSKITGGFHLRIASETRGYSEPTGKMMRKLPDVVRFVLGELARLPYSQIDQAAFDAAVVARAIYAGNLAGLGDGFDEWLHALALEGRAELAQVERSTGPLDRLFAAGSAYTFGAATRTIPAPFGLAETLRGRDEIATRFRALYALDASFGGGASEESFARVVRADATLSDLAELGFATTYFSALELLGAGRTAQTHFLLLVRDLTTAADWLGWQVKIRTEKRSSLAGAWPYPDVYALEPGDLVTLTPLNGVASLKCQVFETTDDVFSPLRRIVLVEVP